MKCPNCQAENPDSAKFYNECGAKLEAQQVQAAPPDEEKKRGRGKTVIIVVGAVIGLCILAAIIASVGGGGGQEATPTAALIGEALQPTEAAPSATPSTPTFVVTSRDGEEVELSTLGFDFVQKYPFENDALGIPTASGVEVSLDYVKEAEFGELEEGWDRYPFTVRWPVTMTLLDGSILRDNVGYKAPHLFASGEEILGPGDDTVYPYYYRALSEVRKITVERASAPDEVPSTAGITNTVAVFTRAGARVEVAAWSLRARCIYQGWCCYERRIEGIPITGGLDVGHEDMQAAEFGQVPEYGIEIPVRIATRDGRIMETAIRPSWLCPDYSWKIDGRAALGTFDLPISEVRRLEALMSGTEPTPTAMPPSAYIGTLVTRDGTSWPFTSWYRAGYEESMPLARVLPAHFGEVKEYRFDEAEGGQVTFTIQGSNGQTVKDSDYETTEITARVDLGTITVPIMEIERITLSP